MVRPRIINDKQIELLLKFLYEHPELVKGPSSLTRGCQDNAYRLWARLANQANSVCDGAQKSVKHWRAYWNELKCMTRKRNAMLKQFPLPCRIRPLAPFEVRVLNLLGEEAVQRESNVAVERLDNVQVDLGQESVPEAILDHDYMEDIKDIVNGETAERDVSMHDREDPLNPIPIRMHRTHAKVPKKERHSDRGCANSSDLEWSPDIERSLLENERRRTDILAQIASSVATIAKEMGDVKHQLVAIRSAIDKPRLVPE